MNPLLELIDNVAFETVGMTADRAVRALRVAVVAMQDECKQFNFPDEDRPRIHHALIEVRSILEYRP